MVDKDYLVGIFNINQFQAFTIVVTKVSKIEKKNNIIYCSVFQKLALSPYLVKKEVQLSILFSMTMSQRFGVKTLQRT